MKQKILIISQRIHPALSPRSHRATELAKELALQGHQVTLCAVLGDYDYARFISETGIQVTDLGISGFEWKSSDIKQRKLSLWRKGIIFFLRKWFNFPDILISFRVAKYLKTCGGYDRIITIAVPYSIHWGTVYAKKRYAHLKNALWISDCGDPFMGNLFDRPPFYFKWVEKWWCKTTNYITVPTEIAIDGYYPEFREIIRVIPQGFVFDESILSEYHENAIPTFAYSGMVYPQRRDPRKLLDFLCNYNYDFHFVVYTNKRTLFEPYIKKLGNKLEMRDYVPREQLLHELSKMDFLINIRNESAIQAPSKLIDYYLTHRPILEITSDFCQEQQFKEFFHKYYESQLKIQHPEKFNIVNVARQFVELK